MREQKAKVCGETALISIYIAILTGLMIMIKLEETQYLAYWATTKSISHILDRASREKLSEPFPGPPNIRTWEKSA